MDGPAISPVFRAKSALESSISSENVTISAAIHSFSAGFGPAARDAALTPGQFRTKSSFSSPGNSKTADKKGKNSHLKWRSSI
jgi:hypothetical protein